ncbi:MAG: hypothetical protein OXG58_05475 [Gemmatimonadetes bacterium]|nr:hypothetical protein [Gemmatimonadota bacterium]
MTRMALWAEALAALALCPGIAAAQPQEGERECTLARVGGYTVSTRSDSVHYNHRASGGIDYRCADGTRIRSDSAVVWEHSGSVKLVRRVRYEDADTKLRSDTAYYFGTSGEMRAWSRVVLTDQGSGAVLRGDSLFFQRKSRYRKLDRIRVQGGNPRAVVTPAPRPAAPPPAESVAAADARADSMDQVAVDADSDGSDGSAGREVEEDPAASEPQVEPVAPHPYLVEAPRLYIDGRRYFRAGGGVVVTRDSLEATGDSLDYDQEVGAMLIFGDSRVVDRGFELRGAAISVSPTTGRSEEIVAHGDAELTGDQVLMRAPSIRLFLGEGQVDRIVAIPGPVPLPGPGTEELDTTGLTAGDAERALELLRESGGEDPPDLPPPGAWPRPLVRAADFDLTGDSIEVLSPSRVLESVTAIRGARAEAVLSDEPGRSDIEWELPEIAARDWIEGERIVASFLPADSGGEEAQGAATGYGEVRLETITATTNARSLYRVASDPAQDADPGPDSALASDPDAPDAPPADEEEEARPPALHYVSGDRITVHMEGRQVVRMDIEGRTTGYHFEPLPPDSAELAPDSLPLDSLAGGEDSLPRADSLPLEADSTPGGATGVDDGEEAEVSGDDPPPPPYEPGATQSEATGMGIVNHGLHIVNHSLQYGETSEATGTSIVNHGLHNVNHTLQCGGTSEAVQRGCSAARMPWEVYPRAARWRTRR